MSHQRAFDPSLQTSGAVEKRDGGATHSQIALQGEEKDCEALVDNPTAHSVDYGPQGDNPPAVENAFSNAPKIVDHSLW